MGYQVNKSVPQKLCSDSVDALSFPYFIVYSQYVGVDYMQLHPNVIPAKAGIQTSYPELLRSYALLPQLVEIITPQNPLESVFLAAKVF